MKTTRQTILIGKFEQFLTVLSVMLAALLLWSASAQMQGRADSQIPEKQSRKPTVKVSGRGFPGVVLQDGKELKADNANNSGQPTSMTVADFDSDGVADLVTADQNGTVRLYKGNVDSLYPNSPEAKRRRASGQFNDDAFYSTNKVFNLPIRPDFLAAGDFNADGHKDILAAAKNDSSLHLLVGNGKGDFAADRAIQIEGNITALATGEIGRADGQTDLAVAVTNKDGAQLLIFEHPEGAFKHKPEVFRLPSPATAIAIGNLDDDYFADVAVACGNTLIVVHGRGQAYPWDLIPNSGIKRPPAMVATRQMGFEITALAVGRSGQQRGESLALLGADGNVYDLEPLRSGSPANIKLPEASRQATRGLFLPTDAEGRNLARLIDAPIRQDESKKRGLVYADAAELKGGGFSAFLEKKTKEQIEAFKKADKKELEKLAAEGLPQAMAQREQAKNAFLKSISARPSTLAKWNLQTLVAGARFAGSVASNETPKMLLARVSAGNTDDILLLDSISHQIHIVRSEPPAVAGRSDRGRYPPTNARGSDVVSLDVEGAPLAVLPMRLNADALTDLVVLRQGSAVPSVVLTASALSYVVNTTTDSGNSNCQNGPTCELREAMQLSNSNGGATISFNIPGAGVHTISPLAQLPVITQTVTINGASQPDFNGKPLIEIKGNLITSTPADGLKIRASNCLVANLAINEFTGHDDGSGSLVGGNGLTIESTTLFPNNAGNQVLNNYLGTDPTGAISKPNTAAGLNIFDSDGNDIGGNLISGNQGVGVSVTAGNSNFIFANIIGLNALGTAKLGNGQGMLLTGNNNQVGGEGDGDGNTISGNGTPYPPNVDPNRCSGSGLSIPPLISADTGELLTNGNTILGNKIGTNPAGTQPFGNCFAGIDTHPLTTTTIGSITQNGRNIVSDNGFDAIHCDDFENQITEGGFCAIAGNNIGTDITGTIAMGNDQRNNLGGFMRLTGVVDILGNLSLSTVGAPGGTTANGACTGFCNLISGNTGAGPSGSIRRTGNGSVGVFNNFIGTNQGGFQALPNVGGVGAQASGETDIGGVGTDDGGNPVSLGNLISGNQGEAIDASGSFGFGSFSTTLIQANLVGTDTSGNAALPNDSGALSSNLYAVNVGAGLTDQVTIGSTDPLAQNIISGNAGNGIETTFNFGPIQIVNNLIGLNRSLSALGNARNGILVQGLNTQVGGTSSQEANQIAYNGTAGNGFAGVLVIQNATGNTIRGNSIHDNSGLGIDLTNGFLDSPGGGDGVTPNDECDQDADTGANMLQNFPDLVAPVFNGDGTVTVPGALKSSPSQHFTIDFYLNAAADPSGHGEGQTYLGATDVSTDTNGFGSFSFTSATPVSAPAFISATATDDNGNTSEFSCNAGQSCDGLPAAKNLKELKVSPQSGCPPALIVNVTGDESDQNPDDGVCDIDTATPGLQCTLRAALEVVTKPGYVGTHNIAFNIPGAGIHTIAPTHPLPAITQSISIDGATQPGYVASPLIELRGDDAGVSDGLVFATGSDKSWARALTVNRFLHSGIVFQSNDNELTGSYIGPNADGLSFDTVGRQLNGVRVTGSRNRIGGATSADRNVLTGNSHYQILITTSGATGNTVSGNLVSVFADTTTVLKGGFYGVEISQGASNNHIGGNTAGEQNFIAGPHVGVSIIDNATANTVTRNIISECDYGIALTRVSNNLIGGLIDLSDTQHVPTNRIILNNVGVLIDDAAPQAAGALAVGTANSGKNYSAWLRSHGSNHTPNTMAQTTENRVSGNEIGTDGTQSATGNQVGIIVGTASDNIIGGSYVIRTVYRNVISGNVVTGVLLSKDASNNKIDNNFIGTTVDGQSAKPNGTGVIINGSQNQITKNTISGNTEDGLIIEPLLDSSPAPTGNVLEGNRIGINQAGDTVINNGRDGVSVNGKTNRIGTSRGNVVSGNTRNGITILNDGNSIFANRVGTNLVGDAPLGNGIAGIFIANGMSNVINKNICSGNQIGILIGSMDSSASQTNTLVQKNFVGTNLQGTAPIPNTLIGIRISSGARDNIIGGVDPGGQNVGNVISGNGGPGIGIGQPNPPIGSDPVRNKIQGNFIGTDKTGSFAVMNHGSGVFIFGSASETLVGGFGADIPLARNIISGNGISGVDFTGSGTATNRVSGNYIGTAKDGVSALGNAKWGIVFDGGAHNNLVGGTEPNAANTIAFNKYGVSSLSTAGCCNAIDPNVIYGNDILGIDLGCNADAPEGEEVTDASACSGAPLPNDPGDGDTGPNNLQNYPEFTSALLVPGDTLVITYKVDSAPANSNYGSNGLYVEIFKADASLQGQTFIAGTNYTTTNYTAGMPGPAILTINNASSFGIHADDKLVATATDADGNTSEFTSTNVGIVTGTPSAADGTIGGQITDSDGAPVSGATVNLSGTQSRETITDANGKYSFFDVETNGFYTITPSRVDYIFTPANRSFSLLGAHTEASFTATTNGDHANAIDTTEFFVRQQYLDFLSREPDPPGFNGWVNTIRNCAPNDTSCDRVHVSEMFFRSQEFQERGYFAYRFYSSALGRKPDYVEFTPDLLRVSGFLTNDQLEAAKVAFINDFAARTAFVAQYHSLSNTTYVDTLLQTAGVTLSNRQALIDSLNNGAQSRAQVLRQIVESAEVYQKYYNQAFVVMEYFGYLRRQPDALYLQWIQFLDTGASSRTMVTGFVNSLEYRQRFGP